MLLGAPVEVLVKVAIPRYARMTNLYKRDSVGKLLSADPPSSAETPAKVAKPRACLACDRYAGLRSSEYSTTLSIHPRLVQKENLNAF
ncbi:uncharacterized protein EAF01_011922 [Botrytis porri]|uniref:uncharacterized protein n=1 Tax=Botrytis porri TaxID=87229 RepID=UPI0019025E22|nr:uncharacterized protein EAF01_011922 [Botrytis porri]KAF7880757.1 hypothetical protein EAF01_011922 [Botrytis porri]